MTKTDSHLITLSIENLNIKAIIGVLESERTTSQNLHIKAKITYFYSVQEEAYIDYALVSEMICQKLQNEKYDLLESALCDIAQHLKSVFPAITSLEIHIKKPDILAPIVVGASISKHW